MGPVHVTPVLKEALDGHISRQVEGRGVQPVPVRPLSRLGFPLGRSGLNKC